MSPSKDQAHGIGGDAAGARRIWRVVFVCWFICVPVWGSTEISCPSEKNGPTIALFPGMAAARSIAVCDAGS